jgi:hypothetical protein
MSADGYTLGGEPLRKVLPIINAYSEGISKAKQIWEHSVMMGEEPMKTDMGNWLEWAKNIKAMLKEGTITESSCVKPDFVHFGTL